MKNEDLTVVLTLRGRHLHTLRWLWHANRTGFPFHVIVADGEVHPAIERLASDPTTFPNLSFEYHRHNDQSYSDFYGKCVDTIRKVTTRYVMMSDNDDFAIVAGIQKSIDYLNTEPDFVCAGGQLPDFSINPRQALPGKVVGRMTGPRFANKCECRDISFPTAAERVMHEIRHYQSIYYHVYRTPALRMIFEEIKKHDFSDLTVHEYYCALRTVTLGKVRIDPAVICYLRQTGTSSNAERTADWVHQLLHGTLPQDFRALASTVADAASKPGMNDSAAFREGILDAYAHNIRHLLAHTMLRHRFPGLFRIKQGLSQLTSWQIIPEWYRQRRAADGFWTKLSNDCTEPALLAAYRDELTIVESSLRGDEFLSFIQSKAPELLADQRATN